jgi:hypothetical protein
MNTARDLTARLADLLRKEHGAMADFLVMLAGFDARKLWRDLGHASLFAFLRRELGLSAGAAQYRKTAAELVRKFPAVSYDYVTATKPYAVQFATGAGRVTYTSFHNEAQATSDMQRLLESMVFGL